jgi:hypothetical protein
MKPIQYRSEHYKAEKCLAELFVLSADSAAALDAAEEVFEDVAVAIEQFGEVMLNPTRNAGRYAGSRSTRDDSLTKVFRVESTVRDDPAIAEFIQQMVDHSEIVPVPATKCRPTARPKPSTTAASLVLIPPLVFPIAWAAAPPAAFDAS